MKISVYYKGYHWPHVLFFTITPLLAIAGLIWRFSIGSPPWETWVLTVVMLFFCGVSTTGGYHRLFSHLSYKAKLPVRFFYIFFGAGAFEGSVRWWCAEHRNHHLYTDTERDPYGINKGFWYAHIGWLFTKDQEPPDYKNVRDLDRDPLIRLQDRFYPFVALFVGFVFPTLVAALWGDPWGGFILAGLARMVLNHHATFCINSVCHYVGKQTYSDKHSARDSWISALLTYGEGYHNFHHTFQHDYRNGIRAFHWDPTKWFIQLMKWTGLAEGLRTARKEKILMLKLAMDHKRFARRLPQEPALRQRAEEMILAAQTHLQQAYTSFQEMRLRLKEVKRSRMATLNVSITELQRDYRRAKLEFKIAMAQWRALIKGPITIPSL